LLAPIKQLTEGAQAFASRNFDTRIETTASDELGHLASHFNTMAESLERYERMRKQWLLDISHELRTPLSILQGEIEAMQDGLRDTNQEMLDSVHSEVLHISRIVNDLHELSLFESGGLHLKKEPVFIVKELRERILLFQKSFAQHSTSVTDKLGNDEMLTVMGDKGRLAQLFANLLDNTLRHTDAPGSLLVSKTNTDSHVSLYFEDSAPGVPDESLDYLFDRLYRVDPSRNRSKGGSGLGLAIAKNIVESHGGEISAAHSSLRGLKITIVLPLSNKPL
jgi:two-component system sensor histidine kinase BaeS